MPKPAVTPILLIDDAEVDLAYIWAHSQDDPYPGGHRYRLWLPSSLADPWLSGSQRLSELGSILRFLPFLPLGKQVTEIKMPFFVLNTIDKITSAEEGVEVEGECSPHCSQLECPYCGATIWANWLFDYCDRGDTGSLLYGCKECGNASRVELSDETIALTASDGNKQSTCKQHGLKHAFLDGRFTIAIGKLRWER